MPSYHKLPADGAGDMYSTVLERADVDSLSNRDANGVST
jgi:hypothetical protein